MLTPRNAHIGVVVVLIVAAILLASPSADAAKRQGDRFGFRLGAWPQQDVQGTLARISLSGDTLIYDAEVEEKGEILPFLELYGLFNLKGFWWVEISAGYSQRTSVNVDGDRVNPPAADTIPRILLGEGRVDFLPLFLGVRGVKEMGTSERPHNIYGRGGISMLIAAEQPNAIDPRVGRTVYSVGTKAAFGFLIGAGGEYYLDRRFGLVGDVAYRLSDLNYTDDGDFDLSGIWVSAGVTLRVR